LMHHPTAIVTGVFDARLDGHKGPFACALYCQEFYETDRARGALRGVQLQRLRGSGPVATALGGGGHPMAAGCDLAGSCEEAWVRLHPLLVRLAEAAATTGA
jgi:hypothetical protein